MENNRESLTVFWLSEKKEPEFFNYEHQTIKELIGLSAIELEMVLCCQNIWHNVNVFEHWHVFEKTCVALNDRHVDFHEMQDLTVAEIAWALFVIRMLDSESKFSEEVLAYIAIHLYDESIIKVPDIMKDEKAKDSDKDIQILLDSLKCHDHDLHILSDEQHDVQKEKKEVISNYFFFRFNKLKEELKKENLDHVLKEV